MKLSIIIPVYRVEATLDRCIESVVRQDFTDFELILVDDGSPDRCPQICDEWAGKDPRIHIIHQSNGGLSAARNAGIEKASGDYLTFIDSDDYIGEHTLMPLTDYLTTHPETDILEYPAMLFYGAPHQQHLQFQKEKVYHDMEDYWFHAKAYQHSYAWNKLYRASLFREIRYPEGEVFEDLCTLHRLLQYTHTLATVNTGCYYYCYNPEGITAMADGKALAILLKHHVDILSSTSRRTPDFQAYYMQVVNIQIDVYRLTGEEPILPVFRTDPTHMDGSKKLKAIIINTLGIKRLCQIFKFKDLLWRSHSSVSS